MDDVLKIHHTLADELRDVSKDITEADSEVTLFQASTEVDGFYSVGYMEDGQLTDHIDGRRYIIRERNQYYSTNYDVGRDNTPNGWADTTEEDGETFVVFTPVVLKRITRIDWVRDS